MGSERAVRVSIGLAAIGLLTACSGPAPITSCVAAEGVTPVCGFQNPEDLVDGGFGWLIVSQAPRGDAGGNLLGFRPSDGARRPLWPLAGAERSAAENASPAGAGSSSSTESPGSICPGSPDPVAFAPHGIALGRDRRSLLAVNHGGRESVERFTLTPGADGPSLVWLDCVLMPEDAMMNDVASLPGGGFVVTRMLTSGVGGMFTLLVGRPSGRVYRWEPGGELEPIPGSDGRAPNGVEVSEDGNVVYFSEWAGEQLVRIGIDGGGRRTAPLGFSPDNLTWRSDGRLLVAGQLASPLEATACFEMDEGSCGLGSAVAAVDPDSLETVRLWTAEPAAVMGGVSVALDHEGRLWLGTFGGDRIAWIESP